MAPGQDGPQELPPGVGVVDMVVAGDMPAGRPDLPRYDLPRYRSHKIVQAGRIDKIVPLVPEKVGPQADQAYNARLVLDLGPALIQAVDVSAAYLAKHAPQVGGYYVRYEDGYESFSPAAPFESGYTRVPDETAGGVPVDMPERAIAFQRPAEAEAFKRTSRQEAMDGSPAFVAVSLGDLQRAGKFKELPLGAEDATVIAIQWQCGPLQEVGVNGCSLEDVIDVLDARLAGFQAGPFQCVENDAALRSLRNAKEWLLKRTARRREQGVEGRNQAHRS